MGTSAKLPASPQRVSDSAAQALLAKIAALLAGSGGTASTVAQGAPGAAPWLTSDTAAQALLTEVLGALAGALTVTDAAAEASLAAIQGALAGTVQVADSTARTTLAAILSALGGSLSVGVPVLGQAASATSLPVVVASDQVVPVDLQSDGMTGSAAPAQASNVGGTDGAGVLRALRVDSSGTASVGDTAGRRLQELQYLREADQVRLGYSSRGRERIPILSERGGGR